MIKKSVKRLRSLTPWSPLKHPSIPSAFRRDETIFIHVPKAAGSTINLCLFGYRNGHRTIESCWQSDSVFAEAAFKFSFVRHPYFRFVSAYNFLAAGGMSTRDAAYQDGSPDAFSSICEFAEACEDIKFRNSIIHLRPQAQFLSIPSTDRYKIFMDFVGKTEFLNNHIDLLHGLLPQSIWLRLAQAKQIRVNSSVKSQFDVDRDAFQKIRLIYQDDFELFGYDEWGTPEKTSALVGDT